MKLYMCVFSTVYCVGTLHKLSDPEKNSIIIHISFL